MLLLRWWQIGPSSSGDVIEEVASRYPGITEEFTSWERSNEAGTRETSMWGRTHAEAGQTDSELLPVAIYERKTYVQWCWKGILAIRRMWLEPNSRSWRWVADEACASVSTTSAFLESHNILDLFRNTVSFFSLFFFFFCIIGSETVSVWFTEVNAVVTILKRCFLCGKKK